MSLSFKDSLMNNTNNTDNTTSVSNKNIVAAAKARSIISEPVEPISVMAYSVENIMPLAEDEGWTAIPNKEYRFYNNEYNDEGYSTVDELKNIILDPKQFNITQEQNSQYIPFQIPRYYDGFDLSNATISIYYMNENMESSVDDPVDVYYNDTHIRFAWLVSEFATRTAGVLKFEIHARGINSKGETYVWKSRSIDKLNVIQSLEDIADREIGVSDEVLQGWITQFNGAILEAQQLSTEAKNTLSNAEELVAELERGIESEVEKVLGATVSDAVDAKLDDKMSNYYTKSEADIEIGDQITTKVGNIGNITVKNYVDNAVASVDISDKLGNLVDADNLPLTVEQYVKQEVDAVDVSDELGDLGTNEDGTTKTVVQYVDEAVAAVDVSEQLQDYAKLNDVYAKTETYSQDQIDEMLSNVNVDLTGYATETYVDNKTLVLNDNIEANKTNISSLSTIVGELQEEVNSIDKSPRLSYEATYGSVEMDDGSTSEHMFTLWEVEGENEPTVKSRFQISGGSGTGSGNNWGISYVTMSPLIVAIDDKVIIKYKFWGTDSSGDIIPEGTATWSVNRRVIATNTAINNDPEDDDDYNEFDITQYISTGTQTVTLSISDAVGNITTPKTWKVQKIDLRLESTFNDKAIYPIGAVSFEYTPYGSVSKDVHFVLDREEIGTITNSLSGIPMAYELPAQAHGSHLLEVYMAATINGNNIESNHILKDIIWYDEASNVPVIGTTYQDFTARQYDTTNIEYTVYDPTTESPTVIIAIDGEVVSTPTLTTSTAVYPYKETEAGTHTITITCGDTVKTLIANIEELDIDVSPVTAGLVFDFNPVGKSNNDSDRIWSADTVAMTVSENFDWVNGGYQIDNNGDQYFCIKAGTSAEINYQMFADDAKKNGKEMKLVFKTTNVSNPEATFLKCLDNTTDSNHIGIQMDVHEARIYAMSEHLPLPYAEDEIIEFEFNINKDTETPHMVMGYEDGVSTRPLVYEDSHNFTQINPKVISLGSPDCDLHIYRFKVYNTSLTDRGILSNFIADARNAEEMIARYDRNQIYDENGQLTPEVLAEKCPQLRIIKIDTPRFTKDKDDKVGGAIIECIYKNGDPILDNWIAYDAVTSGQGTSSNNYGASGRNLDLIVKTYKDYGNNPYFVLGDGKTEVSKVSLTRNSVETNYFNVKVNIASSENANNALLQKRYNDYNPYNRPFVREDETEIHKIKDTMEFVNCVIFVRESDPDLSTHVEFADDSYHFYAIGNIGDSKKTDSSRLTDKDDKYECILEVMDNTLPNSSMPTGKVDENGAPIYPISPSEWAVGNTAYDSLMAEKFDEKKAADKENGKADTYGWRYLWEDGSNEENAEVREYVENKWREFYAFIVTSTDEEFKAHLGDYCVLDSILYYYLFTLRYTMTDNHGKNSFFHYGKSNDVDSDGNPIRKWDLCFDYDNDFEKLSL